MVLDVAGTAQHLHGVGGHLHRHVRAEQLRHRRLPRVRDTGVAATGGGQIDRTSGFHLGGHVGQQERQSLEREDRPAELLPRHRVFERVVERSLGQARGARGDAEPAGIQRRQGDREAVALCADQPVSGDTRAVEVHRRGRARPHAHLVLGRGRGETGSVARYQEAGDAVRLVRLGAGHHAVEVGDAGVRDPCLVAVQLVAVGLAHGVGGQRRGVRAGLRFGQAVGTEALTGEQLRQQPGALLVRAEGRRRVAGERVHADRQRNREPGAGQHLQYLQVGPVRLTAAAVLLGVGQAEEPGPSEGSDQLPRELTRALSIVGTGPQLLARELLGECEQFPRLVGEARRRRAVHWLSLRRRAGRDR